MIRFALPGGFAAALAACMLALPAPSAAAIAPPPEQIYLDALQSMAAMPVPPFVTFKEDVTGRNLHSVCSPHEYGGVFSVDGGGRHTGGSYLMTYYAKERSGSVEDLHTHERCKGPGLFAPFAAPDQGGNSDVGSAVRLEDVVGQTMHDERKTYSIALSGEVAMDGAPAWKLVLTPHDDQGEIAQKYVVVDEATRRIREIWQRYGGFGWAGGAHVDVDVRFAQVQEYWVVNTWSLNVNARALVVPLHYAFEAHAYDYSFGARRQATAPAP